jgi:DNA invertase Pin-like site-specific DNA recombinase
MHLLQVLRQKQVSLVLIKDNLIISQKTWDKELRTINTLLKFLTFSNSINTSYGISKARKLGKTIGRPPKLSKAEEENIRTLFDKKEASVMEIAKKYDVSRATVYRIVG